MGWRQKLCRTSGAPRGPDRLPDRGRGAPRHRRGGEAGAAHGHPHDAEDILKIMQDRESKALTRTHGADDISKDSSTATDPLPGSSELNTTAVVGVHYRKACHQRMLAGQGAVVLQDPGPCSTPATWPHETCGVVEDEGNKLGSGKWKMSQTTADEADQEPRDLQRAPWDAAVGQDNSGICSCNTATTEHKQPNTESALNSRWNPRGHKHPRRSFSMCLQVFAARAGASTTWLACLLVPLFACAPVCTYVCTQATIATAY